MTTQLELDPFYLNKRRVTQLVGPDAVSSALLRVGTQMSPKTQEIAELAAFSRLLRDWLLRADSILSFEVAHVRGQVAPGLLFTVHRDFFCKGVRKSRDDGGSSEMYAVYKGFAPPDGADLTLRLLLNGEHVAPGSPGELLSGRVGSAFVIAVVHEVVEAEVRAVPLFVGHRMSNPGGWAVPVTWDSREVHIDSIDSFSKVASEPIPTSTDAEVLRQVPEDDVKRAFARIIGEPVVPLDWGGERSDMFSSFLRLNGNRVSAAFVFKGPAKFRPMTLAELGKNGDQVDRLASEPAELLVVQHCHQITNPVRTLLRAFCNQVGQTRRFCVISGYDTLRLLRAYGECGFSPSRGGV